MRSAEWCAPLAQLCMEAALECVRTKMHMIDIDAAKLPGELLDSLAVSQALRHTQALYRQREREKF